MNHGKRRRTPLCPHHEDDAYADLWAMCRKQGWIMGVSRSGSELLIRVKDGGKILCQSFRPGHENEAAATLLTRLRKAAA